MRLFPASSGGDTSGVGPQGPPGADGADGADGAPGAGFGISYLGNYNPANGYVPDIAVVRGSDGQLYLAKASGALGDPINYASNGQWEVWIPKGADGSDGAAGADALWNFTGEWVNGIDYGAGSVVEFQGSTYYHPTGQFSSYSPPTNGWLLVSAKGADGSQGEQGDPGETGPGVATGGTAGQVLSKIDSTNYNTQWTTNDLNSLSDVTVSTPLDKQLIVYDNATSQWVNANPIDSTGIAYKSGVPATPTSTGQVGQLAIDGVNAVLYVCTSTNNWQKVSLNAANFTNAGGFV